MQKLKFGPLQQLIYTGERRKITGTTKSMEICYMLNINCIYFKTVRRVTEMAHQQRVSLSASRVIECAVGESR